MAFGSHDGAFRSEVQAFRSQVRASRSQVREEPGNQFAVHDGQRMAARIAPSSTATALRVAAPAVFTL